MTKFTHNGRTYTRSGKDWLDEYNTRPPLVIINELNRRYPPPPAKPPPDKRPPSKDEPGILNEIFPLITDFIHRRHQQTGDYVSRDDIAAALLADPQSRAVITTHYQKSDHKSDHTPEWHASNLVAWFGYKYTTGQLPQPLEVERATLDGQYAYKPVS